MRLTDDGVQSVGKLLEVIPIVETAMGQPFMLPPVIWPVQNWLMGYRDDHPISTPITFWTQERLYVPGSSSSNNHRITFMVRVMEDSEQPSKGVIRSEDVGQIIDAIKKATS